MEFQVPIHIRPLLPPVNYHHNILLTGSCFTEHIGNYLHDVKFKTLQNPNGILFDPISVCNSLVSYIHNKEYGVNDLFYLDECWHSWQHHSRFSKPGQENALKNINDSINVAHRFLKDADWLIITLGSSFVYRLNDNASEINPQHIIEVANCHKAPASMFTKHMLSIEETVTALDNTIHQLFHFNNKLRIMFTISPVRHIRDGVTDNNRSKARLIEAVHHLVSKFDRLYYFPAYELVIDVLRDYRFYDIDLVHPNYAATQFVLDNFFTYCLDEASREIMKQVQPLVTARRHKPFNNESLKHKQFLRAQLEKAQQLQTLYPWLQFEEEINYFSTRANDQ